MGRLRIGFPRTLFYYLYYPFWHTFFTCLGCEMRISSPTNKASLDLGTKEAVNDACLPIKLYHGHVAELKGEADIIFLPRMVSVRRLDRETFCPKILGLPDMIKNSIEGLPRVIDQKVDLRNGFLPLWKLCCRIAAEIDHKGFPVWQAFCRAKKVQEMFEEYLARGIPAQAAIDAAVSGNPCKEPERPRNAVHLAILGYPYLIYDSFINTSLFDKLCQMGVKPWTAEMVPAFGLERQKRRLPKNLFWNFSNRTVWAAFYYLKEQRVDGIVHVTAFGCGPDAMVDKLMEIEAKNEHRMPFMTLTLDEHTGEAGVLTRIEAFVDMLRLRKRNQEGIISHYE